MGSSRRPQRIPLDLIEAKLHLFDEAPDMEKSLSTKQFFICYYDRLIALRQDKGYSHQQIADFLQQHFDLKLSPATVKQYLSDAKLILLDPGWDEDDPFVMAINEQMEQEIQKFKAMPPTNTPSTTPSEEA